MVPKLSSEMLSGRGKGDKGLGKAEQSVTGKFSRTTFRESRSGDSTERSVSVG
ncbi:hypothetical protein R6Q57_004695 [Mikania cordata]